MHTTLIRVAELQALQQAGTPLRIFDCSFDLMNPSAGHAQFVEQHIAGALHADLDHANVLPTVGSKGCAAAASTRTCKSSSTTATV